MTFEEILERDGQLAYMNKGVSMLPLIREGRDVMVIEKKSRKRQKKLDAVLFKRQSADGKNEYVLHRIVRVNKNGTYYIVGDNCRTGETVSEENIIGVLTAVVRDGKTVPVTKLSYKLYKNTWCRFYHVRFFIMRCLSFAGKCAHKVKRIFVKEK